MIEDKFNVVLDAFWGSSGKGKVSAFLAKQHRATDISCSNGPNAGHTVETEDGARHVFKCLPSATVTAPSADVWLGPSSVLNFEQMAKESDRYTKLGGTGRFFAHPYCAVVSEEDKLAEDENKSLDKIGSTAQGTMYAKITKMMRQSRGVLATHSQHDQYDELANDNSIELLKRTGTMSLRDPEAFYAHAHRQMRHGRWLHEVAQGYTLSIDHGQFPYVTSQNCTVQHAMDDFQVPPSLAGDVYLVVRSFPIRVGNGRGYSGPFIPYAEETDWETIIKEAGMNEAQAALCRQYEITTVTKRVRRVGKITDFSKLRQIVENQGATKIVLNFANYIDAKCWGARHVDQLTHKVLDFVEKIERETACKVSHVGTGSKTDDFVVL